MGISYKRTYLTGHDVKNAFFIKVFCSWDYAVTQKSSATIKSKSIYNDFMVSGNYLWSWWWILDLKERSEGGKLVCLRSIIVMEIWQCQVSYSISALRSTFWRSAGPSPDFIVCSIPFLCTLCPQGPQLFNAVPVSVGWASRGSELGRGIEPVTLSIGSRLVLYPL